MTFGKEWFGRAACRLDSLRSRSIERKAVASTRQPGYGVFDAGDALIRYRSHGTGPAIVFATDPPVVLEQYDELVRELSRDHTVIVVETPGFGFSAARPGFAFSLRGAAASTLALLTALGRAPYVLAFPCATAFIAVLLSSRHPELVSGLVLAQAPSFPEALRWKARRDPRGILSTPFVGQLAMHAAKKRRTPAWFDVAVASRARRDAFVATSLRALHEGAAFSLASAFQRFLVADTALPVTNVPTLALWGLGDRSHASTDRASSARLSSDCRIVELEGVGHFPELEEPARFGALLREFRSGW